MKELTKKRLQKAGWAEDRQIDFEPIENYYNAHGFTASDCVKNFIVEFGMLEFNFPMEDSAYNNSAQGVHFNPYKSFGNKIDKEYFNEIFEEYPDVQELENIDLYPVGETERKNMVLLMGSNGSFFSYTTGCLVKHGDNINEMLDCLIGEFGGTIYYD